MWLYYIYPFPPREGIGMAVLSVCMSKAWDSACGLVPFQVTPGCFRQVANSALRLPEPSEAVCWGPMGATAVTLSFLSRSLFFKPFWAYPWPSLGLLGNHFCLFPLAGLSGNSEIEFDFRDLLSPATSSTASFLFLFFFSLPSNRHVLPKSVHVSDFISALNDLLKY